MPLNLRADAHRPTPHSWAAGNNNFSGELNVEPFAQVERVVEQVRGARLAANMAAARPNAPPVVGSCGTRAATPSSTPTSSAADTTAGGREEGGSAVGKCCMRRVGATEKNRTKLELYTENGRPKGARTPRPHAADAVGRP